MISKKLTGEDIPILRNEKGNICISVIGPTHRLSPERKADKSEINKAMEKAKQG